jgi:hypothetical protein
MSFSTVTLRVFVFENERGRSSSSRSARASSHPFPPRRGTFMAVAAAIAHGRLLRSRPAAQPVPRGQSVLTAGAHELLATLRETRRARPELLRFLVGHMFADACVVSIPPRERFRPLRGNASLVRARTTRTPASFPATHEQPARPLSDRDGSRRRRAVCVCCLAFPSRRVVSLLL